MSDVPNWRVKSSGDRPSAFAPRPRNGESPAGDAPQRQPNRRFGERSQRDDSGATEAIAEGRRIYLGNLQYQAKADDVKEMVAANEAGALENLHISVDPLSGRNPGYCFLEFANREAAESAMAILDGKLLLEREVKARPCVPKGDQQRRPAGGERELASSGFPGGANRWGDWKSSRPARDGPQTPRQFESAPVDGKQLYVGGLPKQLDQAVNEEELRTIFQGYEIEVVGKRISPRETERTLPGRHNFCFVDFSTPEQAKAALEALDGSIYRDEPLKISVARGKRREWSG